MLPVNSSFPYFARVSRRSLSELQLSKPAFLQIMAKKRPKYCGPHNPSGLAYVWVDGKQIYFKGHPHGSPESWNMYQRFIRDWDEKQNQEPDPIQLAGTNPLVAELSLAFLDWANVEYETSSKELNHFHTVVELLVKHFGTLRSNDFGPRSLTELRSIMVNTRKPVGEDKTESKWNRTTINQSVQRVRRIFKWGVANEFVNANVWHALQAVEGLKAGRTPGLRETKAIGPAPIKDVNAVIAVLPPTVATMLRLQLLTGMRSDNVCQMQPADIDCSGKTWMYQPRRHKTQHRGVDLVIPLGPKAQVVLHPFLDRDANAFVFDPRESARWTQQQRRKNAKNPVPKSRRDAEPKINPQIRDHYDSSSYRGAVIRGCAKAKVDRFFPHQLRHNCATAIQEAYDLETARAYLGHTSADVTAIYAERSLRIAVDVAGKLG